MLHPESTTCTGKDCILYILNLIIWQAPVILSTKCNCKHHISISTFEKGDDSSDQNNGQPDSATTTNFSNNRKNILLQTCTAVVPNINNSEILTKFDVR